VSSKNTSHSTQLSKWSTIDIKTQTQLRETLLRNNSKSKKELYQLMIGLLLCSLGEFQLTQFLNFQEFQCLMIFTKKLLIELKDNQKHQKLFSMTLLCIRKQKTFTMITTIFTNLKLKFKTFSLMFKIITKRTLLFFLKVLFIQLLEVSFMI